MTKGETFFILMDWTGNIRKCKASLTYLEDWEFVQSITVKNNKKELFMIVANKKDRLVIKTIAGDYLLWVRSIPISDTYSSLFQVLNKETKEKKWLYNLKVIGLNILNKKEVNTDGIKFFESS